MDNYTGYHSRVYVDRSSLYYSQEFKILGVRTRMANFAIKLLAVVLYLYRAHLDQGTPYSVDACQCIGNTTCYAEKNITTVREPHPEKPYFVDFKPILWVCRPTGVWIVQTSLASFNFTYAWIMVVLRSKGNIIRPILTIHFFIEMITTVPFIVSIFYQPLRNMYIPVFLNIWMANEALGNIIVSV